MEGYKNIYLKVFADFEDDIVNKYRNPSTGKIYK